MSAHTSLPASLVSRTKDCVLDADPFLAGFSWEQRREFAGLQAILSFPARNLLFLRGQDCKGLFVIHTGDVKLFVSSRQGKSLILKFAHAGEIIGLTSTLLDRPYEVSAETLGLSKLGYVPKASLHAFLKRHSSIARSLSLHVASQYKSACERFCAIELAGSVFERVANFLLSWSAQRGAPLDGDSFDLSLNHQEIGDYVGASRESVTRTLGELRKRRLIAGLQTRIVIPSRMRLSSARPSAGATRSTSLPAVRLVPDRGDDLHATWSAAAGRGTRRRA
jgi:CRP/FNR family transcriptional regulator, cyclic AMP receptor protein